MSNISATLEKTGTLFLLKKRVEEVLKSKPKALTLLISAGNEFTSSKLDPLLTSLKIPVSGGIFHKIIFGEDLLDRGSVIIAWYKDVTVTNYKNIENTHSIKDLVGTTSQTENLKDIGEYLIFIDGAVSRLEENLDALYKVNGFRATFAGGGAGLVSLKSSPCIISNEGLLKNVMQTIGVHHKLETTITHGWEKQSGPHLVTSSKRTSLKTINYESVVPFYKNHSDEFNLENFKSDIFENYYMEYPIGIENLDGDLLLRSPLRKTEESIEFGGNIPEYSKVHIFGGTKDSARKKIDKELEDLNLKDEENIDATFIFSCVHRDDADESSCSKEVKMLSKHLTSSKNIVGALTLAEIATSRSRLLQLHNKTIVISRLRGVA